MMVEYNCPRCGYTSSKKSNIKNHINRKIMCKTILSDLIPKEYVDEILKGNKTNDELKLLKREVKELKNTINELKRQSSTIINNNNDNSTTTTTNIINITLPHSDTNHEFLTDKDYIRCINRMILSVPHLIKHIYFNPAHPENHNIYISNIKENRLMVFDGKQWNIKNHKNTIDQLINDHEYLLEEWLENGEDKYPKAMEKFKDYLNKKSENGVEDTIKEEINMLLYNNRQMVKKNDKINL